MIAKSILFMGHKVILVCDRKCEKAWGINNRPDVYHPDGDEDNMCYKSDGELGVAPEDPGTYEGGDGKPRIEGDRLNRWCARECERSILIPNGDKSDAIGFDGNLPDLSRRMYNCHPHYRSKTDKGANVLSSGFIEIVDKKETAE